MRRTLLDIQLGRNFNQTKFLIIYFTGMIGLALFFIGAILNLLQYKLGSHFELSSSSQGFIDAALPGLIYLGVVSLVEFGYWFYNWVTDYRVKKVSFINRFIDYLDDEDISNNTYVFYSSRKLVYIIRTLWFHTVTVAELTIFTMVIVAGYFDELLILELIVLAAFILREVVRLRQGDSSRDI